MIFYCSMLLYYLSWMFYMLFYMIFGTNLLTGGPTILLFYCLFQCFEEKEYQMESKRNETFGRLFLERKQSRRLGVDVREASRWPRGREARLPPGRAPTLMGPSWLPWPTSFAYIYSYTLKTSRSTTKPYFHRHNLLYPWDPILGPFPASCRRGHWSRRASTSTP